MNIMYFLPSIPLLIVSSLLDEPLDRRFGESSCGCHAADGLWQ